MNREHEIELFQHLVRTQRLTDWVQEQLDEQVKILLVNPNIEQLHRAQGSASVYKGLLEKLAAAKVALQR